MSILRRRELIVAVALYFCVFAGLSAALLSKHRPGDGSDYWVHLAAITSLAEGSTPAHLPLGGNPELRERHYDPSHAAWALVLRHTPLSGTDVMALAGIVNIAVFLCGLAFLASRFGPTALTASCFLLVMLFMWGIGYGWSNEYYLSILPGVGPFPSTLAWGLSFFVLGLIETWARRGGALRLAGAILLGMVTAAVHPLTALMFTLTFPVLWVWLGRTTWRRRWTVLLYPGTALVLSLLWGPTNALTQLHAVFGHTAERLGMTSVKTLDFLSPAEMLLALGPAPVGVLFLACVPRRRRLPLAAGMAMYAVAWFGGSLIGVPLAHRFLFFLVFTLHLTTALALKSGWRLWRHRRRLAGTARWSLAGVTPAVVAVAALLFPWVPLHVDRVASLTAGRLNLRTLSLRPSPLAQLEASCARIRAEMPPGGRVLTEHVMARQLAAFGVPIVPDGGLYAEPAYGLTPFFVRRIAEALPGTGATDLVLRWPDLKPAEREAMSRLGTVTTLPPDIVLVRLKQPAGQGGGGPS